MAIQCQVGFPVIAGCTYWFVDTDLQCYTGAFVFFDAIIDYAYASY